MAILNEPQHNEAFLVSEAVHTRSREAITVLAGAGAARVLTAGMVLGRIFAGTAVSVADSGNVGTGVMGAITVSGQARAGNYRLLIIEPAAAAGTFALYDPRGVLIGSGTVGVAFNKGGLSFTLADGTPDFAAGDAFTLIVTESSRKFVQWDETGTNGSELVAGVLRADVTALDGVDADGVAFVRDCEVNDAELVFPTGITQANRDFGIAELAKLGIIAR